MSRRPAPPVHQRGVSLLLALLLLALLSVLVTHALQANQWQRRIASHEVANARAMAAAHSAARWAEQWVMHQPGDGSGCMAPCSSPVSTPGVLPVGAADLDSLMALGETWWLDHAHADGFDPATGRLLAARGISGTPIGRWLVIGLETTAEPDASADDATIRYFKILARAVPAGRGQPVLIEIYLARPWGQAQWRDDLPAKGTRFCTDSDTPQPCGRLRWRQRP